MSQIEEKIFSIFLSSTYNDLRVHRDKVITIIQSLGHMPIAMEFFGGEIQKNTDFIEEKITLSDIFILILGNNGGNSLDDARRL